MLKTVLSDIQIILL